MSATGLVRVPVENTNPQLLLPLDRVIDPEGKLEEVKFGVPSGWYTQLKRIHFGL